MLKQGQEGQRPDYLQPVGPQALCLASTLVLIMGGLSLGRDSLGLVKGGYTIHRVGSTIHRAGSSILRVGSTIHRAGSTIHRAVSANHRTARKSFFRKIPQLIWFRKSATSTEELRSLLKQKSSNFAPTCIKYKGGLLK